MPATLAEWLERIERAHPEHIALGLERSAEVAARMGLGAAGPAPAIVVAGTNGKGSCVAVMERLLLDSGARVGAYTSPHLRRYAERVRIGGQEVDETRLCAAFVEVEHARGAIPLTYFEFGTLAALAVFRDAGLDRVLLEVGLGGRLDAVNIVDADVSVITTIQLDHTEWLGPDRSSIAREKAGILRAGRAAVIGERDPPETLREAARSCNAIWFGIGEQFDAGEGPGGSWSWRGLDARGTLLVHEGLPPPMLHSDNVACALQALALCDALPARDRLARELPRIGVEGRFDRWQLGTVECIVDVAHNAAGMTLLARRLGLGQARGRTIALVGAMRDKDLGAMLAALAPAVTDWVLTDLPGQRAAMASDLRAALGGVDAAVRCATGPQQALALAFDGCGVGDRVVVCGSFHTVGPALDWLEARGAVHGENA